MHPIINIALKAARQAGDVMLQSLDRLNTIHPTTKGRHDFVTDIDKRAEAKIIDIIKKAYPNHSILSEESGAQQGDEESMWIIDPLDGTHNYMRGVPHFSVSIGFKHKGKMEHGLVYDPIRQEIFSASRGQGARLNDKRIRVSQTTHLENALVGTGFPVRQIKTLPGYLDDFKQLMPEISNIRCLGSAALDTCYVASGRLDAFIEIGLSPWDLAAGSVIIQEAGGLICDWLGEENYLDNGTVIATTPKILHSLLTITKQKNL